MKKVKKKKGAIFSNSTILLIVWIFILLLVILFTYAYIYNEDPIYIFDYSGYFENFKLMGNQLAISFKDFWNTLVNSVRNYEYNYSSVVPLMPFYFLFGESRLSYIMSVTTLYLFPCIMLITYAFMRIIKENNEVSKKENMIYLLFTICLTFMYTKIWAPTLRGYTDICGLIPIIISYLLISKRPLAKEKKLYYPVLLGLIVYLPFLFRRWYAYYIVGFCITIFLFDLVDFFKSKDNKKEAFFRAFRNYLIFGLTMIALVALIQLPYIKQILSTNYNDMYSSYQIDAMSHLIRLYNDHGLVLIILALLGIIFSLKRKKYIKVMLFCTLNVIIFIVSVASMVQIGLQHCLGFCFWLIILVMLGIRHIYELLPKYNYKNIFLFIILILFAINFSTTFIFRNRHVPIISQNTKYYKFRYEHFDEVKRLINDLGNLVIDSGDDNDTNKKFTVFAESEIISDNLIDLLGDANIRDNIAYTNHIDSKDEVSYNGLFADYAVVTNKSQLGSNPTGQYVIDIPNKMIYKGYGIGKAYSLLSGPYTLEDGVLAYIYKKDRNFTKEEIDEFFEAYYKIYPDWQEKYDYLDKAILYSDIHLGSYYGNFKRMDSDTYFIYPGGSDTYVKIPLEKKLKNIKLKFYFDYSGNDPAAASVLVTIKGDKKELFNQTITKEKKTVTLDLEDINNLTITFNKGEELIEDWFFMDVVKVNYK